MRPGAWFRTVAAGALAIAGALASSCAPGRGGPDPAPPADSGAAPRSARSVLLAELYDPRTKWAGAEGAFIFVGGDRTTVFVTWTLGDPRSLAALEAGVDWMRAYQPGGVRVVGVAVPYYGWEADSAAIERELNRRGMWIPVIRDPDLRITRALGLAGGPPRFVLMSPEGSVTMRTADARLVAARLERMVLGLAAQDSAEVPAPDLVDHPAAAGAVPRALELGTAFAGGPGADAVERSGPWRPRPDGVTAGAGGSEASLALRYHAAPLGAVLSPPDGGAARVWIRRDGRWLEPGDAADDVRFEGAASYVAVEAPRLYALCRDDGRGHVVTLAPEREGVTVHGFRFEPVPAVTPSP